MSSPEHTQAPRTAWINAMRAEVLRVGKRIPEVSRVVAVGVWIATYADADGTNAFPGRETLACLAGCSQETVTRSVRVLMGVGVLQRRRRPNASAMYVLIQPLGPLPWETHIHHYTDTRQRKAHAKKKAEEAEARKASMDAVRTASTDGVPDSVHGGGSEPPAESSDSVHGRPRTASTDAFRTASMAGVYKCPPTSGRDPRTDKDRVAQPPQPPVRVGARGEDEPSPDQTEGDRLSRRCRCGIPLLRARNDKPLCAGCERAAAGAQETDHAPVQGVFLAPVPSGAGKPVPGVPGAVSWPRQDPTAPLRVCGCGREYRDRHVGGVCPDCQMAALLDEQQYGRGVSGA